MAPALRQLPAWRSAIRKSADPARVKHFLDLLAETSATAVLAKVSADQARILAALFSGSEILSTALARHPEWVNRTAPKALRFPRRKQGLQHDCAELIAQHIEDRDYAAALRKLRLFKQVELFRIATRDLAGLAAVAEIILELSDLADVCLDHVWKVCLAQFHERYGMPCHQDVRQRWVPTAAAVLGMGKLGGQELNYSSDVDLMIVYTEEGSVFKQEPPGAVAGSGRATLNNHQFFNRLAEAFVAELTRVSDEESLYRIDLRLRPEGEAGPLTRSLSGYENYYAQWGQTWERMMLIKARGVAGDQALAAEFLEMVQPFRYPRSINVNVLREVSRMKGRIEVEVVKSNELDRNVKLGRGGIREIEFIVQGLQVIHAGKQPFLQGCQTLPLLEKLAQYELLPRPDSLALAEAYCFLRAIEHRLQMDNNLQTHTIPESRPAQERLARLMGFPTLLAFNRCLQKHRANVRRLFDSLLGAAETEETVPAFPRQFEGAEAQWKSILSAHAFRDPEKAFRVLREFVQGPGFVHVSPRTVGLAYQLLPRLFELCPGPDRLARQRRSSAPNAQKPSRGANGALATGERPPLSDPDRVITRLDSFISAYGARSTLFELWNSNPGIFELLLLLFDRSEFLAELAIRTPDLVDELVTSGRLRQRKTAEETLRDLRHGIEDEDQHLWLRRYHQTERMRIGLRDILGLADPEQYLTELSALADACLQYAAEVAMKRARLKRPPFVVIGLGKLGGAEIDYGSDLDVVFVCGASTRNAAGMARIAVDIMDLLSRRTEQGLVFQVDARLRPDGEKGLMVNTLAAFEDYYRHRAMLWEIQSLTRARPVAGDLEAGKAFRDLAALLTDFSHPNLPLQAYAGDWKARIHQMRMRIENERTPKGKDDLAIKTGFGGLMDAEFVAQGLCLEQGWQEANTLRVLERAREAGVLEKAEALIRNYRHLRRVEGILRRWSYEGESVLPDDPAPFYRVSVRCGFLEPEAFRQALQGWRREIREVYLRFYGTGYNSA